MARNVTTAGERVAREPLSRPQAPAWQPAAEQEISRSAFTRVVATLVTAPGRSDHHGAHLVDDLDFPKSGRQRRSIPLKVETHASRSASRSTVAGSSFMT